MSEPTQPNPPPSLDQRVSEVERCAKVHSGLFAEAQSRLDVLESHDMVAKTKRRAAATGKWLKVGAPYIGWATTAVLLAAMFWQPGCIAPTPVPPPPIPIPIPVPPPTPTPPAPIPAAGLRVLMVYDQKKLTPALTDILFSKDIADYLNAKCAVGADGKTREWRVWPKTVDVKNETAVWKNAFNRPRAADDWIIISDGKTGFEGPIPLVEADVLTLLKKYGG